MSRKYERRAQELETRRYFGNKSLDPWYVREGELDKDQVYSKCAAHTEEGRAFCTGEQIQGKDRYLWMEKTVEIPCAPQGCETALLFDFGKAGGHENGRFEAMLYVDGEPLQGVDENHKEILLGEWEGETISLTFLVWSGINGTCEEDFILRFRQADLVFLNKAADKLYYFMKAMSQTVELLPDTDLAKPVLIQMAQNVLELIDWDEKEFSSSVEMARQWLDRELEKVKKEDTFTVHGIGHTHIDVAWLWRLKHTREKAQRSFATVLRLMDRYEDYLFLQSQPQLYQYIKEDCPALYEKIQKKVQEGKWEAEGGMWVEADCNIPSGESFVRQLLYGIRFFEKEFGKKCKYLWLPDVFGYSWALPQILKLCNIDTFMTTKISWNETNQIPEDLFWWKGIDGSRIMTYFIETPEEQRPDDDWFSTYNGMLTPKTVLGSWRKFKNRDISQDVLISYGYGDGGGGVTREMLEMRRLMDQMPGLPRVKTDFAGDFFDKIHIAAEKAGKRMPVWDGELYLEFHRGTYTTQAYNKKMNRRMELLLPETEWLSVWSQTEGNTYETEELAQCWRDMLLHQFHDIIPGSSVGEVYEDSRKMYQQRSELLEQIRERALEGLVEYEENHYVVTAFNGFSRKEYVQLPENREGSFWCQEQELETQKVEGGYLTEIELQPFEMKEIAFVPGDRKEPQKENFSVDLENRKVDTPFYELWWKKSGQLARIYDKKNRREVLEEGACGNVLELYEDKPLNDDAWNIDTFYKEKMEVLQADGEPSVTELGNLRMKLCFTYHFRSSVLVQELVLYKNSPRIDFETYVDWKEEHRLLKTAFYTGLRTTKAVYEIQFGHVERPTHRNTSWDKAKFEVCGHQWADLSEYDYGFSLLNNCKYGYSGEESALKLSLLRSPKAPDPMADMGEHRFTYSILPHRGQAVDGGTVEEAVQLNHPAWVIPHGKKKVQRELLGFSRDKVRVDAIKRAEDEDAVILRFHEYKGGRAESTLTSDYTIERAEIVNLLEEPLEECTCKENQISFVLHPFELKTVKLYFKREN